MTYAQRPMGDYKTHGYAGDPGFLSSLWKGFKKVAKFIPGPIGVIATAAGVAGALGGKMTPPIMGQRGQPPAFGYPSFPGVGTSPYPGGGPWTRAQRDRGSAAMGFLPGGVPRDVSQPGGVCPTGYHYAKDGSGRLVRNRRMNVANPRALRRSMRRVQGFEKLAKRTIQFTRRVRMKKRKSS